MDVEFKYITATGKGILYKVTIPGVGTFESLNPEGLAIKTLKDSGYKGEIRFFREGNPIMQSRAVLKGV